MNQDDLIKMQEHMERLSMYMERAQIAEYVQLLNRPRRLITINFVSGIARGVGMGLGITVILAVLLLILQELAVMNLPVIGKYLAEIVSIVQSQLQTPVIR